MRFFALLVALLFPVIARAGDPQITLTLPADVQVKSATAVHTVDTKIDSQITGVIADHTITFSGLRTDQPYDIRLTLADGSTLAGAAMRWYSDDDPGKPNAGPLTADDQEAIRAIIQDIKDFYNKKDILLLRGNHDRAVALVRLMRDSDFHAANGNVIWRIELWYFQFHYGGWEKIAQVNQVVRRERFANLHDLDAANKIRWIPALGGVEVTKEHPAVKVELTAEALNPATRPTTAPQK